MLAGLSGWSGFRNRDIVEEPYFHFKYMFMPRPFHSVPPAPLKFHGGKWPATGNSIYYAAWQFLAILSLRWQLFLLLQLRHWEKIPSYAFATEAENANEIMVYVLYNIIIIILVSKTHIDVGQQFNIFICHRIFSQCSMARFCATAFWQLQWMKMKQKIKMSELLANSGICRASFWSLLWVFFYFGTDFECDAPDAFEFRAALRSSKFLILATSLRTSIVR